MDRPTLLLINKFYHDVGPAGGVGRYLLQEEEDLAAAGWRVVPFAMADEHVGPSQWSEYFVRARDYRQPRYSGSAFTDAIDLIWNREAASKLDALIEAVRPDVAHLHNIYHHLSPSILPVLARHRIPTVMTLHDLRLLCPAIHMLRGGEVCERCRGGRLYEAVRGKCVKDSRRASLLAAFETVHQRQRHLYDHTVQLFLCPSRFYRDKYAEWGYPAAHLRHLPNFVDTAVWRPERLVEAGGVAPAQRSAYIYFGRISREKGLATLLTAQALWEKEAAAAKAGDEPLTLLIAGSGPEDEALRAQATALKLATVEFLGPLDSDGLLRALARARFAVLPSEWYENGPMAALEALAAGLPLVGTDIGGIPELIEPDRTGVVVPPRDPAALLTGLRRAARMGDSAGQAARAWALQHADRGAHMVQLNAILTELLPTGSPR